MDKKYKNIALTVGFLCISKPLWLQKELNIYFPAIIYLNLYLTCFVTFNVYIFPVL